MYNRWNGARLPYAYPQRIFWAPAYTPELYHHGVKGMKWGVRHEQRSYNRRLKRDLRMLNANDYQQKKRSLRDSYDQGSISKSDYKAGKKEANASYKQSEKKIKKLKAGPSSDVAFKVTRRKALNEIPHYRLKRGLRTANTLLDGLRTGALAVTAGTLTAGAIACGVTSGVAAGLATGGALAISLGVSAGTMVADKAIRKKLVKELG